jgi:hypothetical protein
MVYKVVAENGKRLNGVITILKKSSVSLEYTLLKGGFNPNTLKEPSGKRSSKPI